MKSIQVFFLLSLLSKIDGGSVRGLNKRKDVRGKFNIPGQHVIMKKNCQYVKNREMSLCQKSETVRTNCSKICGLGSDYVRGKFEIEYKREDSERNCQYVRNNDLKHDLCAITVVQDNCPETCDVAETSECKDEPGKFAHRSFGNSNRGRKKRRNCFYVGNVLPNLCASDTKIRERCKATCDLC